MPNYTILLIDYEPRSVQMVRQTLEGDGFRVETAADGLKGIELFQALHPDLTLVEAMLPKKHGFEVCQQLKTTSHGAVTPVAIITAVYKGRKYRSQALHHYKADEYLEKPIAPDFLLATVRRLIAAAPAARPAAHLPAAPPAASGPSAIRPGTPAEQPAAGAKPPKRTEPDGKRETGKSAEQEINERIDSLFS